MTPRTTPAIAAALLLGFAVAAAATPKPPVTKVEVVRDTVQGVVIEDPYRWLEDKDSPETRAWEQAQMAFTQSTLAQVPGRDDVKAKLAAFAKVETRDVPVVRGKRLFFLARRADQQQPVLTMRESADGADVALVDPNPKSEKHTISVVLLDVSADGAVLLYGLREGGEDETDVHLLDVATRQELPGGLPKGRYLGLALAPDKHTIWYARQEKIGGRIRTHQVGEDPAKDKVVLGEGLTPSEIPTIARSDDGRWMIASIYRGSAGDDVAIFVADAAKGERFRSVTGDLHQKVQMESAGGKFILFTSWKAPNGRILVADPNSPAPEHWQEIVPERKDVVLQGFGLAGGRVLVQGLRNASSLLESYALTGGAPMPLALPGIGSASVPSGSFASPAAFYSFESFDRPSTISRYDVAAGSASQWWRSSAPFASGDYEVRQIWYYGKDGKKVPMFVVQPKGMAYDGTHPVLMTGYGGFNVAQTPSFWGMAAAWLQMGGVFVSTNLRGGSEFGDSWHENGMRARKQNTFDDFLGGAQWLLTHGYCTREKLAIIGGSNGGLLVGAAITQRPDLFGAAVCEFPLLDMIRYQRFLVARYWVPEYGSSEDAEQFKWLYAYSPYHHVKPGTNYPATLFVSGDGDTRVDPGHARKMAARLQAAQGGDRPILLHYDVTSGHSGGQSVDKSIDDDADVLQFLRGQLGMANAH